MNCDWATCDMARHMLIVDSANLSDGIWQRRKLVPFIYLDPLLETFLKIINLVLGNFKFKAKCKKLNQLNEKFVILFIGKLAIKKSRGKIQHPDWMGFNCHLQCLCCNIWNPRSKCSKDSFLHIKYGCPDWLPHLWCQNVAFIIMVKLFKISHPKKHEVGDEVHEVVGEWNRKRKGAQGTEQGQTLDATLGCKLFWCCISQGRLNFPSLLHKKCMILWRKHSCIILVLWVMKIFVV